MLTSALHIHVDTLHMNPPTQGKGSILMWIRNYLKTQVGIKYMKVYPDAQLSLLLSEVEDSKESYLQVRRWQL